jgi:suppressor of ftsI
VGCAPTTVPSENHIRSRIDLKALSPVDCGELPRTFKARLILDAEVVWLDSDGVAQFDALHSRANDGAAIALVTEFFVGPGQRIDAIVIGPPAGEYPMSTIPFQNQAWRPPDPALQMATIVASGARAPAQVGEAEIMRQRVQVARWIDEIRTAPIARRRTLNYSRTDDRKIFMINRQVINEDRIDQTVKLGDTEEWTVVNTDQQYHSFHIHQTAFLVTEINGVPQDEDSLRDTFSVPPATDIGPSSLKVIIPFTDPVIVGRFVYHCHAVDHEDKGMMGVIEVVT